MRGWIGRLLLAVCGGLFLVGTIGFPVLHLHDHSDQKAPEQCTVCAAHASASSAVVTDADVFERALHVLGDTFVAVPETVVSHAPLTADSRGPPAVL